MKFRFVKDSSQARKIFQKLFGSIDPSKWNHDRESILDAVGVPEERLEKMVKAVITDEALYQDKVTKTVQAIMENMTQASEQEAEVILQLALIQGLQELAGYRHQLKIKEIMGKGDFPHPDAQDDVQDDDWKDVLGC